jgi:hypothetical protein
MGLFPNKETETANNNQSVGYNDPFEQIANSEVTERSVYFEEGVYPVLYLDVMKMVNSRKGDTFFVAEFDILESNVSSRPSGSRATWMANFRHDATPGNVKDFIAKLNGVEPEEVTAESVKMACSETNPCSGKLIRLEAVNVETKSGGNFTRHNWRPIPEELQQKAAELREHAGFPGF